MIDVVLPVVGILRFSFFGRSDLQQRHDHDDAFQDVYAPDRMESRFWFFERIMLPSLVNQTDQDFSLIVISSDIMPEVYKNRLVDLLKDMPQAEIIFAKSNNMEKELHPHFSAMCEASETGLVNTFRIDDDDAVSVNYIARLKETSIPTDRAIVTFPRTICGFQDFDGTLGMTRHVMYCTAIGLARVISPSTIRSPYVMHHPTVWRHNITVSNPTFCCNLRSYHFHNDTKKMRDINLEKMIREMGPQYKTQEYWDTYAKTLEDEFNWTNLEDLKETYENSPKPKSDS